MVNLLHPVMYSCKQLQYASGIGDKLAHHGPSSCKITRKGPDMDSWEIPIL